MSKKRYWEWQRPECPQNEPERTEFLRMESGRFKFTYGWMYAKYGLSSMECPICGVWEEFGEFSFECPEKFRSHPNLTMRGPVLYRVFANLVQEMEKEFEKQGIVFDEKKMDRWLWLQPGIRFQPWTFRIPCHPPQYSSFFWGCNTPFTAIVAEEVKQAFEKQEVAGVTFHPIEIAYVDEPEENPESFGPLYRLRVSHFGPDWRDWDKLERCSYCGQYLAPKRPEDIQFSVEHLTDYDMFYTYVLPGYVVSEKVYDLLQSHNFSNGPTLKPLDVVGL